MDYSPHLIFTKTTEKMKQKFLILMLLIILNWGCSNQSCFTNCKSDTTMESNKDKPVIACSLTKEDMKTRMKVIDKFKLIIQSKEETENGILFHFQGSNSNLDEIINLIKLERQCCPFLTFDLKVLNEANQISLTISGPENTKEFLHYELGL